MCGRLKCSLALPLIIRWANLVFFWHCPYIFLPINQAGAGHQLARGLRGRYPWEAEVLIWMPLYGLLNSCEKISYFIPKKVCFLKKFWPQSATCRTFVPWPGILNLCSLAWKHSLNHWIVREVPKEGFHCHRLFIATNYITKAIIVNIPLEKSRHTQ